MNARNSRIVTGQSESRTGIALIMVIVVLMALLLIATPFAISMRDHQVTVVMHDSAQKARGDTDNVRNLVTGKLASTTHAQTDATPEVDSLDEIEGCADLKDVDDVEGIQNPRARIWSAAVEDEQAKLNVNAISPFALSNLMGARTVLGEKVSDSDTDIPVEDSSMFDAEGGFVVVDAELIKYSGVSLGSLTGCERGVKAVDEDPAESDITESYYYSPGTLVRITDGVQTDYGMISYVSRGMRDLFTGRGGKVHFTSGFTQPMGHKSGAPVLDARVFAVNMYRILREPGKCYRYPTVSAIRQVTDLDIPGFDPEALEQVLPYLTVYSNHEGAARWGNQRTLLDPFTFRGKDYLGYHTKIEFEVRYPVNINTAARPVLLALLTGLSGERQQEEVTLEQAGKLAERILEARGEEALKDMEDFLDRILEPALEEEEITKNLRGSIFQNLFDSPMMVFLKGGTHRAIFNSLDTFTVSAGVSRNNAAGVELSRHRTREVVSVAPPCLLTFGLDSQWDFEKLILPGRYSRFITTFPVNVEFQRSPQDPPIFDPPNRTMKILQGYAKNKRRERRELERKEILASRENEGTEGEDSGSVRYRPHRNADGIRTMRGVDPNRFIVHHFDNSDDIEGERLGKGTRNLPLTTNSMFGRRGRSRRGSSSGMSPMVIGLWYKPLWESVSDGRRYIWGTGNNPNSDKVELYFDGQERALVLEIADTGYNQPFQLSRAYFPIALRKHTWYHIACHIAGTRPDQMQILVDGVPFRGTYEKQRIRFLTTLTADLSENDTSIQVEDTRDFPNHGVLLIGEEKIEFRGKSKKSFNALVDSRRATNVNVVKRGRGSRGSALMTHREGVAVMLFGYANALQSEIPVAKGKLTGAGTTFGRYRPALLAGRDPITTVRGAPLGLLDTATAIPIRAPGGGVLEGFQQSGYALLCSARIARQGPQATPQNPNPAATVEIGGVELIHYQNLTGTELQGVTRGVDTPLLQETVTNRALVFLNPSQPKVFLNGTEQQLQVQAENGTGAIPTWVVPVSLQASTVQGYLDPMRTRYSERVQINTEGGRPEWVRYDELLTQNGGAFFARTNWTDLIIVFQRITRRAILPPKSGTQGSRLEGPTGRAGGAYARADRGEVLFEVEGNGDGEAMVVEALAAAATGMIEAFPAPEPEAQPQPQQQPQQLFLGPVEEAVVADGLKNWLKFRGSDDTRDGQHANNTDILQVFRTERPSAGPDDRVTLVDSTNSAKEQHFIRWGAAYRESNIGRTARTASFASFRKNVARRWISDLEIMRSRGNRNPRDTTPQQINWDTRRVTRILMAPSGELPARASRNLVVGGTFGGRRAACLVDEVETFPYNRDGTQRRIVSPPSLKVRYQNAITPATTEQELKQQQKAQAAAKRYIPADEVNIPLAYADVWTDFDGITQEREYWRGSFANFAQQNQRGSRGGSVRNPFPYSRRSRDDLDAGLIRIGEEFIVYRGLEQRRQTMQIILQNCIRGVFNTEAVPHEQGEAAMFLGYVEMTVLRSGVTADAASLPVENSRGFAPQGYVAVFGDMETGTVREIIGYTEARGGRSQQGTGSELMMPQRVNAQQMKTLLQNYTSGQEEDPDQGGAGIFRGRFGTLAAGHASGSVVMRLPFRYWDRAVHNADNPELGYFQFPLNRHGAFFKSLSWSEYFPQKFLDIRVLARVDQRIGWDAEPGYGKNGLFEFVGPRGKNQSNRIDMQGNLLEVRVFFEYRDGAFDPLFNADGWKETPWLNKLRVDYVQPSQVLYHEEVR